MFKIYDSNIIFQCLGQVVVLVHRQEQGSYSVLGVGKVTQVNTAHPLHLVPVLVAFAEPIASSLFAVGQVILWPREFVAVYGRKNL